MIYHYLQLNDGSGGEITLAPGVAAEMGLLSIGADVEILTLEAKEIVSGLVASATIQSLSAAANPDKATTI